MQTIWNLQKNMCTVKKILIKNMFVNGLNMGLSLQTQIKKSVPGEEIHWLSGKKRFGRCEGNVDSFLGH